MPPPSKKPAKRAKMSTTPTNKSSKIEQQLSRDIREKTYELKLFDRGAWCSMCDEHLPDIHEFCSHLHSKVHQRNKMPQSPWRKVRKEKVDIEKTYNVLKSIAAKISNEQGTEFTLTHLHRALEPNIEGDIESYLRERNLMRERKEFEPDKDPVLQIKGYNYLIPTAGYYCSLCDTRLCDMDEVSEHLKGYNHAVLFAQSVALNPKHEISLRSNEFKSRSLIKRTRESRLGISTTASSTAKTSPTTPTKDISRRRLSATTSAGAATVASYKKATSRIVDEHESIRDKFQPPKRPVSRGSVSSRPGKRRILSDEDDDEGEDEDYRAPSDVIDDRRGSEPLRKCGKNDEPSGSPTNAAASRRKRPAPPEIVPIGGPLLQAASLKRLKSTTGSAAERSKKSVTKPVSPVLELQSESADSEGDEPVIVKTLGYDDPDSPFPLLELSITGNTHINALKDKRLALPCQVVMNRVDLSSYEGMLLDSSSLFSRVVQLVTKREAAKASGQTDTNSSSAAAAAFDAIFGQSELGDIRDAAPPPATFFDASGENIPVELDDESN